MANYNQVSYGTGDKNTVTELQKLLNKNGANLAEDGIFGNQTKQAVMNYQKQNGLAVDGIVGSQTWGALTKAQNAAASTPTATTPAATAQTQAPTFNHTKSDAVAQAEAMLQQHLSTKPGDFSFGMQAGWDDIMNKILNREKFSYDLNGDALYQQYKDQYTTQGKLAMMDTMGQAAAMTGGYGNSYAQSVGQQAYQGYLQQLNDKVPELYQLALNQYNQEGQDLYNQYGLYADKYKQEYGEHRDKVSDYYTDLSNLTDNARYMSETEYKQELDDFNIKYSAYRDQVGDEQWNQSFDYQQSQDAIANEWKQKEFDEAVRQYNASQASKYQNDGPTYKSLDVGSDAYNAIVEEINSATSYEALLAITQKYLGLKYDPDEIEALTAAKEKALRPRKPINDKKYQGGPSGAYAMVN